MDANLVGRYVGRLVFFQSGGKEPFKKYRTSDGLQTLCNGPVSLIQWKSEGLIN